MKNWMKAFALSVIGLTLLTINPVGGYAAPIESNLYLDSTVVIDGRLNKGYGSGVVVAPNKILTARHAAVQFGEDIRVHTRNGTYRVEKVYHSPDVDASLLVLAVDVDVPTVKTSCRKPEMLETLIKSGNGMGIGPHLGVFAVIGYREQSNKWHRKEVILVQGIMNQGDSGGPVFDKEGNVIGLNSSGFNPEVPNRKTGLADLINSGVFNVVPLYTVPELCKGKKE